MSPQLALEATGPRPDPALSQWFTPPDLARDLIHWANVQPGDRVLEPSAGAGNLIRALPRHVHVTAVELDARWLPDLYTSHEHVRVLPGDFFEIADALRADGERFDLAIANPPYEEGLDARFLRTAAALCSRVCAVVPLNVLVTAARYESAWRWLSVTRLRLCCTRPGFGGAHQNGMRDIVFVEVVKRTVPRIAGEEDVVGIGWRP